VIFTHYAGARLDTVAITGAALPENNDAIAEPATVNEAINTQ